LKLTIYFYQFIYGLINFCWYWTKFWKSRGMGFDFP
jgi:hypothetical protein